MQQQRIVNSWRFPEGLLMKTIAVCLHDQGLRGQELLQKFEALVPHWKCYFKKPISDDAIVQRADKARRYKNESPEKNPGMRPYWPRAKVVVRSGKRLTKRKVQQIVRPVR